MNDATSTLGVRSRTKFAMTPRWVARAGKALSPTAKALYTTIMSYADNDSYLAFPGQDRLGADLGVSVSTVHRAMKELEQFGALEVERRRNPRTGNFYGNRYTLVFDEPTTSEDSETCRSAPSVTSENGGLSPVTEEVDPLLPRPNLLTPSSVDEEVPRYRSPSLSERRVTRALRSLVSEMLHAQAAQDDGDDYYDAVDAFLSAFQDTYGEEPGYWDDGWDQRLAQLVADHGPDYGIAKWLSIFTNAARAA